jgi:hypothetical protein
MCLSLGVTRLKREGTGSVPLRSGSRIPNNGVDNYWKCLHHLGEEGVEDVPVLGGDPLGRLAQAHRVQDNRVTQQAYTAH